MATLIRQSVYDTVPGLSISDPWSQQLAEGTIPFTGTSIGSNPLITDHASMEFFPVSLLDDYATGFGQYTQDTGAFGMLASFYGPNIRRAMSIPVSSLYGEGAAWSSFGGGTSTPTGVLIDRDLGNKQAEPNTVAWLRKVGMDMKPTSSAAFYAAEDQYIQSHGLTAGSLKMIQERSLGWSAAKKIYEGNKIIDDNWSPKNPAFRSDDVNTVTIAARDDLGWNHPNLNIGGNGGVDVYGHLTRLAPTSVSRGSGLFVGPRITINTNQNRTQLATIGGGARDYDAMERGWGVSGPSYGGSQTVVRRFNPTQNAMGWLSTPTSSAFNKAYSTYTTQAAKDRWW